MNQCFDPSVSPDGAGFAVSIFAKMKGARAPEQEVLNEPT